MEDRPSGISSTMRPFTATRKRLNLNPQRLTIVAPIALALLFVPTLCGSSWGQSNSSTDCQLTASLPPMATFGAPATAAPGQTELGLAFGGYGELMPSPCIHAGGEDWFVRFRRGMSSRIDLGFDTQIDNQTDGSLGITAKAAIRYGVTHGLRLEAGVGASDQGDGKAVNADVAAVIGTNHPASIWNYYMSLRLGASRGLCDSSPCTAAAGNHLPGALVPLGVIGTTARISDNVHFVMETGLGGIFSREHPGTATYLHLSFGVLFNVGSGRR